MEVTSTDVLWNRTLPSAMRWYRSTLIEPTTSTRSPLVRARFVLSSPIVGAPSAEERRGGVTFTALVIYNRHNALDRGGGEAGEATPASGE
eukprot:scaffold6320_cov126-Isochrysis_galbana.AAC.4